MKVDYLILAVAVCGFATSRALKPALWSPRIVGGEDAEIGEFPYQISYQFHDSHFCGGTIIAENWVMIAGLCVLDENTTQWRIVAGITDLDDAETKQVLEISRQIVHEKFQGVGGPYDIALIELKTSFVWTDAVQPIPLPAAGFEATGEAVLSGWGSTDGQFEVLPDALQKVNVPIVENTECKKALDDLLGAGNYELDPDSNLCTGPPTGGASTCVRDAGGPLVQNGTVVGVVSWVITPCAQQGAPSVYTKVSSFIDWIQEHVGSKVIGV